MTADSLGGTTYIQVDWNQSKRFFVHKFQASQMLNLSPNRIFHLILSKKVLSVSDRKKLGCMYVYVKYKKK